MPRLASTAAFCKLSENGNALSFSLEPLRRFLKSIFGKNRLYQKPISVKFSNLRSGYNQNLTSFPKFALWLNAGLNIPLASGLVRILIADAI